MIAPTPDPAPYDLVIIGTPIWAGALSSPVRAILLANRARLADVAFFCTMGGQGADQVFEHMRELTGKPPRARLAITDRDIASGAYRSQVEASRRHSRSAQRMSDVYPVEVHVEPATDNRVFTGSAPQGLWDLGAFYLRWRARATRCWIVGYGLFFLVATESLIWLGGGGVRAAASLMDVVLLIVPLVAITFAALSVYNAQGFLELLISQPVSRHDLFAGTWAGLVIPLVAAFVIGTGVPLVLSGNTPSVILALLGSGAALTIVFVAIGLLIAAVVSDRIKGLGLALGIWLLLTTLFDGLVLLVVAILGAHAAAAPVLAVIALNPIDLARLLLLTQLDAPALLGYTDAVAQQFLGGTVGVLAAVSLLAAWCAIPTTLGRRAFERRDW